MNITRLVESENSWHDTWGSVKTFTCYIRYNIDGIFDYREKIITVARSKQETT